MNRFEDELTEALKRREPPPGFAERVMARLETEPRPGPWRRLAAWFRPPVLRFAAFACIALLLFAGVRYESRRRERLRAEAARDQAMLALRITFDKLEAVREKLYQAAPAAPLRVVLPEPHRAEGEKK